MQLRETYRRKSTATCRSSRFLERSITWARLTKAPVRLNSAVPGRSKLLRSIRDALEACELKDGATISFHHHLRNGDFVLNTVLNEIAKLGLKDIRIAASSLFPVHAPLVEHFEKEVVTGIYTGYMSGPVATAVSKGALNRAVVMHTHGGRARDRIRRPACRCRVCGGTFSG